MTTSFINKTVSPDLVITTPEQLREAFKIWNERYQADPDAFFDLHMYNKDWNEVGQTDYLIDILKELNKK